MSARKYHVSQTCLVGKCFFQCDPFDKFLTLLSWELSSNDTVPVRMILGGVLGGVSFLAIFVGLVFWYHRKRRHSRPVSTPSWHKAELPGVSVSINPSNWRWASAELPGTMGKSYPSRTGEMDSTGDRSRGLGLGEEKTRVELGSRLLPAELGVNSKRSSPHNLERAIIRG